MSEYQVSNALLRTLSRFAPDPRVDRSYESGERTRAATQPHLRQAAVAAADSVVSKARRTRLPPEQRQKDIERRRKWAGGGSMPDNVRACYTESERAALSVIAHQCKKQGHCSLCIDEIARLAGVSRTSVQNAIRKARSKEHGHISVRERPQERGKSLTNIIKIICESWIGWIARAIGFKRLNTSETGVKNSLSKGVAMSQRAFEKREEASRSSNGCNEYQWRRSGWVSDRQLGGAR